MPTLVTLKERRKILKSEIKHREEALRLVKESLKGIEKEIKERTK